MRENWYIRNLCGKKKHQQEAKFGTGLTNLQPSNPIPGNPKCTPDDINHALLYAHVIMFSNQGFDQNERPFHVFIRFKFRDTTEVRDDGGISVSPQVQIQNLSFSFRIMQFGWKWKRWWVSIGSQWSLSQISFVPRVFHRIRGTFVVVVQIRFNKFIEKNIGLFMRDYTIVFCMGN